MRRRRPWLSLLLLMAPIASAQNWPQEPTTFLGVPFGSSRTEAKAILARNPETQVSLGPCFDVGGRPKEKECFQRFAGRRVIPGFLATIGQEHFRFDANDRFIYGSMFFSSSSFPAIKEFYVAKFGQPTDSRNEKTLANGAEFDNEIMVWRGNKVVVEIRLYVFMADQQAQWPGETGSFTIALSSYLASLDEDKKKAVKSF